MSRARLLASDTAAIAIGTLAGRLTGLVLLPLYTHYFTVEEFGTVELITTAIGLLAPLACLVIYDAVLRYAMLPDVAASTVLRTSLVFIGVASCVVLGASSVVAAEVGSTLPISTALVICLQSAMMVLGAWCRAVGFVRAYAESGAVQAVAIGAANVILLPIMDLGVHGYIVSLALGSVAGGLYIGARTPLVRAFRDGYFQTRLLRRLLWFSAPLVPNVTMWWFANMSGRYYLATTHGVKAVGLFAVSARIPALVAMAANVFSQAWQLAVIRATDAEEADRGEFVSAAFRHYASGMMLAVSLAVYAARPVVSVIAAPEYYLAWRAIPPLLLAAMFASFAGFYEAIYKASGRSRGILGTTTVAAAIVIVCTVGLVPRYGPEGAGFAIAIGFAAMWVLRVFGTQGSLQTVLPWRQTAPGLVLLLGEICIQYAPLTVTGRYVLMAVPVGLLAFVLRGEVLLAWALSRRMLPVGGGKSRAVDE